MLDPGTDSICEKGSVRHDHGCTAWIRLSTELPHDELEEQKGRFRSLPVLGEVSQDAALLLSPKRSTRHNDIHTIPVPNLRQLEAKPVLRVDQWSFKTMQKEVHL